MKKVSLFLELTLFVMVGAASITVLGSASSAVGSTADWPPNPFYLPADSTNVGAVDLAKASLVQTQLQQIYQNEFRTALGDSHSVLNISIDWMNPYFGAFSQRLASGPDDRDSSMAQVAAWGGFIRVPEMTPAALAATFCHELGHHFGGQPKQLEPLPAWSSSEGQADFYAASVCLPRWIQMATPTQRSVTFTPEILKMCGSSSQCQQVAQAGFEFIKVIYAYSYQQLPALSLTQHESLVVTKTLTNIYPTYQCRLDTFLAVAESFAHNVPAQRPSCWFAR